MSTESQPAAKPVSGLQNLCQLYVSFLKIGAFMFGGGYSMLPLLERELIDRRKWITQEEMLDYFAIAQCTPGVIAVNTATFVGQKRGGALGAVTATLGVVTVPILIILLIASVLKVFWALPAVKHAFNGVRAAVAALIIGAVIRLLRSNVKNALGVVLCIFAFCVVAVLGWSPVIAVAGAALAGVAYGRWHKA